MNEFTSDDFLGDIIYRAFVSIFFCDPSYRRQRRHEFLALQEGAIFHTASGLP